MKKNIKIILIVILAVAVIIGIAAKIIYKNKQEGYILELYAHFEGPNEEGEIENGTKSKTFNNIKKGDNFYEPFPGGVWEYNIAKEKQLLTDSNPDGIDNGKRNILKIIEFKSDTIKFKKYYYGKEEEVEIKYGEEYTLKGPNVPDGKNYTYTIKFTKP